MNSRVSQDVLILWYRQNAGRYYLVIIIVGAGSGFAILDPVKKLTQIIIPHNHYLIHYLHTNELH